MIDIWTDLASLGRSEPLVIEDDADPWGMTTPSYRTALTCINDGVYGSDFSEDGLRLTLLRSPVYSCHPHDNQLLTPAQDRFTPRRSGVSNAFWRWRNPSIGATGAVVPYAPCGACYIVLVC